MKKLVSLLLAVVMVMSLSAVSFADTEVYDGVGMLSGSPMKYSADSNTMQVVPTIEYGKAAYYALLTNVDGALISNSEMVDGLKVKVDYEMGQDLVADNGVSVVKKKVDNATPAEHNHVADRLAAQGAGYYYFIEIKTVAQETTSDADIIATLELNKSKKGDDEIGDAGVVDRDADGEINYKVKDLSFDIAINVGYEENYNVDDELMVTEDVVGDQMLLEPETYYLLKYDYDEETEFTFGGNDAQNEGTFTVDVSGQGKNLLYFDTLLDDAIADANPDAKIYALNFNNTKFNRTGEFMYEAEDMQYAYEVLEDGSLKLLGEFDGEEVSFRTRVLGKYLFSDIELVAAPVVEEPEVDETPVVDVVNPGTGAAC